MAERAETIEFWKGVVVGTLAGLVAAAYARGDFRRLFSFEPRPSESSSSVKPIEQVTAVAPTPRLPSAAS